MKNLTKSKLISIYNNIHHKEDLCLINYFLISLCENNLLEADICKRVCYFKERLLNKADVKDIPILFFNNFDDFISTVPNDTSIKIISHLFFLQIEDEIEDKILLNALNNLLLNYKLDTHYVMKSRINNCRLLKKLIAQFKKIKLESFDTNNWLIY